MKRLLVFLALVVMVIVGPLVLAGALSNLFAVGPVEMPILYALFIAGAVFTWRSFRRREALAAD